MYRSLCCIVSCISLEFLAFLVGSALGQEISRPNYHQIGFSARSFAEVCDELFDISKVDLSDNGFHKCKSNLVSQ